MRIGQFSDSFLPIVDGVGRVAYKYCETLGSKGHEVSAIVPMTDMGYRGNFPFEVIDYFSKELLIAKQYDVGLTIDPHYRKMIDTKHFDIVHVHTPFIGGIEGIIYGKQHKVPVVGTFHSKYYDDFLQITGSKHLAEFGTDIVVEFYNHCDEVWTVSENSAMTLESYGYKKPIYVIQNGMDIKDIDYTLAINSKKHFNLNTSDPVLLYVGQLNFKKNIKMILEACKLLSGDGIKYQLVLAGQGPHKKDMEEYCKEVGISDFVTFTGHILDEDLLNGLYALADLFVFPSNYDTYSMVVREAANARTASVVLKGSAPSEVIKDGDNGLLCEDNSEDLYNVLKSNLLNKDKLIEMGIKAKQTIPVSWDVVIDEALSRYQYLIDTIKK